MGEINHSSVEVIDVDDRKAEVLAVLRHYLALAKTGKLTGIMVIAETERGGYQARETKMSGCDNVAERLGRLELLRDDVKASAIPFPDAHEYTEKP